MMVALDRRARGGRCSLPMLPGGSFQLLLRIHQRCVLGDLGRFPSGFWWCWSMGPRAVGTPGRECPREDRDLRPLAGVTRPAGVSVCGGNVGSQCVGETLSSLDVAGGSFRVCLLGGPVVAGGPFGPCRALPPFFHEVLEPLEYSVLDHAGPAGRLVDVGPCGPA